MMALSRSDRLTDAAIRAAAAGLGAAVGGPLGGAIGAGIGNAFGAAAAELVRTYTEKSRRSIAMRKRSLRFCGAS
jgi:hypothetical protein